MANGIPMRGPIDRRSAIAQALISQGLQPQQSMRHPLQVLGSLASAFAGTQLQNSAQEMETERQKALVDALRGANTREDLLGLFAQAPEAAQFAAAMQPAAPEFDRRSAIVRGVPGIPENQPIALLEQSGTGNLFVDTPQGRMQVPGSAVQFVGSQLTGGREDVFGQVTNEDAGAFEDAGIAGLNTLQTASDAVSLVQQNPNILGNPGAVARTFNNLSQTVQGVAGTFGVNLDRSLADPSRYDFSGIRGTAIQSDELKSAITNLAFSAAAASGQDGRSISDKDIQRFIDEIGAGTSDPVSFARTMEAFSSRIVRGLKNQARVRGFSDNPEAQRIINLLEAEQNKLQSVLGEVGDRQNTDFTSMSPEELMGIDPNSLPQNQLQSYLEALRGLNSGR